MNSLEFIDREISSTEIDLWYSKRLLIENPPNEKLKKKMLKVKINVLERNMKCLQQIKAELEAWYVVKPRIRIKEIEDNGNFSKDYYRKYWTCHENGVREQEQVEKIEKALEVKE